LENQLSILPPPVVPPSPDEGGRAANPVRPAHRFPAVREGHPTDPAWRADIHVPSAHGRLEVPPATEERNEEKAADLCATLTRDLLGDFAPALLLLPANERRRVQAILAYTAALFDFARRGGGAGDRLVQIDRFTGTLLAAFAGGEPAGQEIALRMAQENARRRWPPEALADLADCARRRALRRQPATAEEVEAEVAEAVGALGRALLESHWNAEVESLGAALLRLQLLRRLGTEIAAHRCPLPAEEIAPHPDRPPATAELELAVRRECSRLRPRLLRAPRGLVELPDGYRRAGLFASLAAVHFLSDLEDGEASPLAEPPRLPTAKRVALLLRARWGQPG
jgi:phytoene/squalene synthetase